MRVRHAVRPYMVRPAMQEEIAAWKDGEVAVIYWASCRAAVDGRRALMESARIPVLISGSVQE
jgi:hypothetical protein